MAKKSVKLSDRLTDGENPTIVVEFDTGYVLMLNSHQQLNSVFYCSVKQVV